MELDNKRFVRSIWVHRAKQISSNRECMHLWKDLTFELAAKYEWYFRYRAALLQVKYPTFFIELKKDSYDYIPTEAEVKKRNKDKLTANKAILTKWENIVSNYEKNWNSLFPIEDDPAYQNAKAKIFKQKIKVKELETLI